MKLEIIIQSKLVAYDMEPGDIDQAIQKWQYIADAYNDPSIEYIYNGGSNTCSLCAKYLDDRCKWCPVKLYTGFVWCKYTPFEDYFRAEDNRDRAVLAAREEVKFLMEVKQWMIEKDEANK